MGIYDRSYMRPPENGQNFSRSHLLWWVERFNLVFIVLCAIGWFFTAASSSGHASPLDAQWLTYFVVQPATFYEGRVWTVLTYPFIEYSLFRLFFDLLLLWYFGEEIQALYGYKNLIWIYFLATVIGAAAYLTTAWLAQEQAWPLYGVPSIVMCVMVIITLWFPRRLIYFMGFLPVPLFLLTLLYIVADLLIFQDGYGYRNAVAAPLSGAVLGLAFYFIDLRLSRAHALGAWLSPTSHLKRLFDGRGAARKAVRPEEKVINMYDYAARPDTPAENPAKVSGADAARVDALLDKIAKKGKEALTAEELEFLNSASKKYR